MESWIMLPGLPIFLMFLGSRRFRAGKGLIAFIATLTIFMYVLDIVQDRFPPIIFAIDVAVAVAAFFLGDTFKWTRELVDDCFDFAMLIFEYFQKQRRRKNTEKKP